MAETLFILCFSLVPYVGLKLLNLSVGYIKF